MPPERAWYRSLYWRIALGFILCVAVLLVSQALLFVYVAGRASANQTTRSPSHFTILAASELASTLEADPRADVGRTLSESFGRSPQRLVVVLRDGRWYTNRAFEPPPVIVRAARARLQRELQRADAAPRAPDAEEGTVPDAGDPGDADDRTAGADTRRGRRPFRRFALAPILVNGQAVGVVAIVPGPPSPLFLLAEYGPSLALAAVTLLLAGTATMAFFVFAPARRRLHDLEQAARALGSGDTSARAPESGGDEVAALARSFNRMAADLEARVHDLQESDRVRRQLLADVSHELMTPLTAIRGYLETLSVPAAVRDDATRDRYLAIVTEETLRLESIIGDLLDLARLEGGTPLTMGDVPVSALFDRAAARHGAVLADKGIVLEPHVGPGADAVKGDALRLEQVIQNLVANAVRHTPAGGRIVLSSERRGDGRIALIIQDSGPGIPPEHRQKIFDRFYRVDRARDHASGGSGLGLSVVRAIVERHGGSIGVTSPPGEGARFEILLP